MTDQPHHAGIGHTDKSLWPASSSPHVVPVPMSVSAAVDPEEAFVASPLQLPHAVVPVHRRRAGFVVDSYREEAVGMIAKDTFGKLAMTSVTLRPESLFGGNHRPTADDVVAMHGEAHEHCFLARSVKADVRCEPVGIPT